MSSSPDSTQPDNDGTTLPDAVGTGALSAELVARASLMVMSGSAAGRVIPLFDRDVLIGRAANAQVRIPDGAISLNHARIVREGSQHFVVDLGSRNGTFVNDHRLSDQPALLAPGDHIRVADTLLSYVPAQDPSTYTDHLMRVTRATPLLGAESGLAPSDMKLLLQLLQGTNATPEVAAKSPSLEEQLAKLAKLWVIVRRRWVPLVASMFLLGLGGALAGLMNPPPAEATVKVRLTAKPADNPLQRESSENTDFYTAAQENFVSPMLVADTLVSLGIKQPSPDQVKLALMSLTFEPVSPTSLTTYVGTYKNRRPEVAVDFLRRHVENFFTGEVQRAMHVTQAEADFLSGRVRESEAELTRLERELKEFKEQHLDGLPEHTQNLISTREALLARRIQVVAESSRANTGLAQAQENLREEMPLAAQRAQSAQPFETALVEAKRKLSEARAKGLGDQHPEVIALEKQVEDFQRMATQAKSSQATAFDRQASENLTDLRHKVGDYRVASQASGAELGQINAELARIEKVVNKMPEVEARYALLTRSHQSTKDMHARLFERLRSSQLQLELERTSAKARFEILSPPEAPPLQLRKAILPGMIVGMAGGFGFGAVLAALFELRLYLKNRRARRTAIVPVSAASNLPVRET